MEQILSSIRKIISDDQKALGLPMDDAPVRRTPRRASPPQAVRAPAEAPPPARAPRAVIRPAPARPAPESAYGSGHDDADDIDLSLHRMSAGATRMADIDTGLPPRARPPVRLSAAPPVDYRPPEAREQAEAGPSPLVDQRLADIIRRAVAEQVEEVTRATLGGQWPAATTQPSETAWPDPDLDTEFLHQEEAEPSLAWPAPARRPMDRRMDMTGPVATGAASLASVPVEAPAMLHAREAVGVLVTPATAARISGAFDALTQRVAAERARTMEETVTDMLRPMLAGWLEAHLPEIVERLVAEQVNRLSRSEFD
ncbi:PopZ family protein [Camelimonas sp. ID_303_24]